MIETPTVMPAIAVATALANHIMRHSENIGTNA